MRTATDGGHAPSDAHDDANARDELHEHEHEHEHDELHEHDHEHEHHDHDEHEHEHHDHEHHEHEHHDHDHAAGWRGRLRHALTPHSHDATEAIQTAEEASADGVRAAWVSLIGMGTTAGLQVGIVAVSGSIGLLADTLHNVGHLFTTIPLLIAFRLGRRAATARYPHGFRRAEDLVGVLIAAVIAVSAGLIIVESLRALVSPPTVTNLGWVLAAGLVGAAGNEAVAVYRIRVGRRIGSAALIAEGQHARADGLTSLAVVGGVVGIWLGWAQADAVVGLVIAVVIVWILLGSVRSVFRRLMDGVDDGVVAALRTAAGSVPGVTGVERTTARWSGHRMLVEATVTVRQETSLSEGDVVAAGVDAAMRAAVPHLEPVHVAVRSAP